MRFDEHFVTGALSNVSILYSTFPQNQRFSIDSRTLQAGDIFVALPGERCDGHEFVPDAFKKDAAGCVIAADKQQVLDGVAPDILNNKLVLVVRDTLQALIRLASAWREQFTYPVVAITGSVGKTSSKELLANILTHNGNKFVASRGNQNTNIGVALNILRMRSIHNMAVFELGIAKRGEMAELSRLVKPTTALITNIGYQHMDDLGSSLHDIALEKRDVFKYFTEESIGMINGDQTILSQVSYSHPVLRFGSKTTNQIQARKIRMNGSSVSFILKIYKKKHQVVLNQPHMGTVFNSLAAAAAAHLLGIPEDIIIKGIQVPVVIAGRFEWRKLRDAHGVVINDCYNANPESMKASLLAFQHIETQAQKIAVLGDMLGLGVNSPFWHRQLGRFLRKIPSLKHIILVGDLVQWTQETLPMGVQVEKVPTWQYAVKALEEKFDQESLVLVKGSLGMGLGNLVNAISVSNPKENNNTTT